VFQVYATSGSCRRGGTSPSTQTTIRSPLPSPRQQSLGHCHLSYMVTSQVTSGRDNMVADTLSCPPQPSTCKLVAVVASAQVLDNAAIAEVQWDCPSINIARDSSLSIKVVPFSPRPHPCAVQYLVWSH